MIRFCLLQTQEEKACLKKLQNDGALPLLKHENIDYRRFIAAKDSDGRVIGLVSFVLDSSRIPGALGVSFVSVHPAWQGKGIARRLVTELFELARHLGKDIANTRYTEDGQAKLRSVMQDVARQYPDVRLFEKEADLLPA